MFASPRSHDLANLQFRALIEAIRDLPDPRSSFFICSMIVKLPYNRAGVETMTIGAVVGQSLLLVFHCHACGRVAQADAEKLRDKYGTETKLSALRARARCSNCEKKNLAVLLKRPNALHRRDAWVPYKPDDPMR